MAEYSYRNWKYVTLQCRNRLLGVLTQAQALSLLHELGCDNPTMGL